MPGLRTTEIYKGVFPYIVIQFCMIIVVILFPGLVMHYKTDNPPVGTKDVNIEIQGGTGSGLPGSNPGGSNQPAMGLPPLNFGGSQSPQAPAPSFGLPPLDLNGAAPQGTAPASPATPDLSQPPKI